MDHSDHPSDTIDRGPMTTTTAAPALLEASFADVVAAIENAHDLPVRKRSHWLCSLGQIATAMDRPMTMIPARWTSARFAIGRLHHARVGSTPKTLANHKSNVRAALRWFAKDTGVPSRGMPLTAEWELLRSRLSDRRTRATLSPLMRYCAARRIAPPAIDEAILDGYMRYRAETTALASDAAARRAIARAWKGCVGGIEDWPVLRLVEPEVKAMARPAWDDFPEGLKDDVAAYLKGLTRPRHSAQADPALQAFDHSQVPG